MLHSSLFWIGVALAPIPWLIVLAIAGFSFRQGKAIKEWYVGLPIVQWPAMFLVILGCKVLRTKKYCYFRPFDGRYWISPNVRGFKIPEETPNNAV